MQPDLTTPYAVTMFVVKNTFVYVKVGASWYQFSGAIFPSTDPYQTLVKLPTAPIVNPPKK